MNFYGLRDTKRYKNFYLQIILLHQDKNYIHYIVKTDLTEKIFQVKKSYIDNKYYDSDSLIIHSAVKKSEVCIVNINFYDNKQLKMVC